MRWLAALAGVLLAASAHAQAVNGLGSSYAAGFQFYGTTGLLVNPRCVQANVTSSGTGTWSLSFTASMFPGFAGFVNTPNVQAQAISTGTTATTLINAYVTAESNTAVSGVADSGNTIAVGGSSVAAAAGTVIQVRACGT